MTFGQFIYVFRKSLDLTQKKFSEKLEELEAHVRYIDPRYIQRWEHDKHVPRKATVLQIRMLNAASFDKLWLSVLCQYEFQQLVSEAVRSRRFQLDYRFGY
jgi:transcriptional regulator with XRE-family HTH domain